MMGEDARDALQVALEKSHRMTAALEQARVDHSVHMIVPLESAIERIDELIAIVTSSLRTH